MSNLSLQQHSERLLPLLLDAWSAKGYRIGVQEHLELRQLLRGLPPETPLSSLKTLIAPLFALDAQQQDDFYEAFDASLELLTASERQTWHSTERASRQLQRQNQFAGLFLAKRSFKKWVGRAKNYLLVGLLCIAAALGLKEWLTPPLIPVRELTYKLNAYNPADYLVQVETGKPIQNVENMAGQGRIVQVLEAVVLGSRLGIHCRIGDIGLELLKYRIHFADGTTEDFHISLRADLYSPYLVDNQGKNIPATASAITPGSPQRQGRSEVAPGTMDTINLMTASAGSEQRGVGFSTFQTASWQWGRGEVYFSMKKALVVALSALALWLLAMALHHKRRKFALKHPEHQDPHEWFLSVPMQEPVVLSDNLVTLLREMRKRNLTESSRIDYPRTVSRTASQAGMLQLEYRQNYHSKEFLVLNGGNSPKDHRSRLYDTITERLQDWGAPIVQFQYEGDIRQCGSGRQSVSLRTLQHKYADSQLLLFGEQHTLLDPASGNFREWTEVFDGWKKKVILTPHPVEAWGKAEAELSRKFKLLPATPKGFGELMETLDSIEPKSLYHLADILQDRQQPILLPENAPAQALYATLLKEFADEHDPIAAERMLRWVIACALPPVLFWDWTRYAGSLLSSPGETFLTTDRLFQLVRLPWFVEGVMPTNIRKSLLQLGERHFPEWMAKISGRWNYVLELEENLPPEGSIAWQHHRIHVLLSKLLQQSGYQSKRKLESELEGLLEQTSSRDALVAHYLEQRKAPLAKLSSERIQKLLYRPHLVRRSLRDWVWQLPLVLLVLAGTLLYQPVERVTNLAFDQYITALTFSPDSRSFAVANGQGEIGICTEAGAWRMGIGTEMEKIIALQYSADGRFLAAGSTDGGMAMWDTTGKQILAYQVGDSSRVTACAFSPTLDTAFIGHFNGRLTIWDMRRQQEIRSFKTNRFQVNTLCFSPKNARLYTGGSDGNLVAWTLHGDSLMDFQFSRAEFLACALSPDGNLLLIGGRPNTLCVWDLSQDVVFHIAGHSYDVFDVHFSPDGKFMLSTSGGSVDNNARLWTLDRKLVRKLGGHSHDIKASCFSPDGSRILTGDGNGNVKVWKVW